MGVISDCHFCCCSFSFSFFLLFPFIQFNICIFFSYCISEGGKLHFRYWRFDGLVGRCIHSDSRRGNRTSWHALFSPLETRKIKEWRCKQDKCYQHATNRRLSIRLEAKGRIKSKKQGENKRKSR